MPTITHGGNELLRPEDLLKRAGVEYKMTVADLGCGATGFFTFVAADIVGEDGRVYAVDVLKSVLASIASKAKQDGVQNVHIVWSNLEVYGATKIKDASCDIAFLVNVMFQSTEHEKILREAARMVKIGGRIFIVDWKRSGSPLGPPMTSRLNPQKIRETMREIGFREIDAFEAGQYHFGLVFEKLER